MKFPGFFTLLPAFVLLAGCTVPILKDEVIAKVDWSNQLRANNEIQRWVINGRIAVSNEEDGSQLDYEWKQLSATDYEIRLQAPFGMATVWISGRAQEVSLKTSSGEVFFDSDVDRLMYRLNGWRLPIKGLHYWVRGLPSPQSDYRVPAWDENGMPEVILQDGWRIEFRKHTLISQRFVLPRKVFISRPGEAIEVRLIVRKWSIE